MKVKNLEQILTQRIKELEAEFDYTKNSWGECVYFSGFILGLNTVLEIIKENKTK